MQLYKFETTVLPNGIIKTPQNYHLENTHVEVVIYAKHKKRRLSPPKMTAEIFFDKWAGILEGAEIENFRNDHNEYLDKKYQ